MTDQAQKLRELVREREQASPRDRRDGGETFRRANVITVTSGKGGVGKSNIAVNLGIDLASQGYRVAVVDMDLGLANVNVITDASPRWNLLDVFEGRREMPEVLEEGPGGIQIIAGASGEEQLANQRPEDCRRVLGKLSQLDELVDYLMVDTSAGLSDQVLQFITAADQTLLVTTPEPTAITDAYAIIKSGLRREPRPQFRLIINRAGTIMEAKKVGEKMKRVGEEFLNAPLEILGYVIEDDTVPRAVRRRRPFVLEFPDGDASHCVKHLTNRITGDGTLPEPGGARKFFSRLMGWLS